jgi:hypothetical protein
MVTKGNMKAAAHCTILVQGTVRCVSIFALQFGVMAELSSRDHHFQQRRGREVGAGRQKQLGAWATINYKPHSDWQNVL